MKIVCISAKKFLLSTAVFAVTLAAMWLMYAAGSYAVNAFSVQRSLPVYSVDRADKKISISFDCAWGVEHTDAILNELERHNVKCTFFAVEFWVKKYPEYVKKIVDKGHEMATHSKTHPHMSALNKEQITEERSSSKAAIEEITGVPVTLFRPPFGDYDNLLIDTSNELGLLPIQWDVDSLDWKNLSATEIALRVINATKSGSIILCHNNGLHTAEALPTIFSTLQNSGYEFVPIGELVYRENYTIDSTGKQKSGV
ncbi:MAG: polysaccharide deacetylase family protein [Clostridia bacterium]|nr:polysaccharide deacetylase family protein [Clostridia bacterium]